MLENATFQFENSMYEKRGCPLHYKCSDQKEVTAVNYIIHEDGTFDIITNSIRLNGCYPSADGHALRPVRVETSQTEITYLIPGGFVRLSFRQEPDGRLALSSSGEGMTGIHDFEPLGRAEL